MNDDSVFQGHPPDAEQELLQGLLPSAEQEQMIQTAAEHWRRVGNEAPVQTVARIEDAAKQLIGLTGALQGLYFAIYAFSDLRKQVGGVHGPVSGWPIALFFFPILLWLGSLICATLVFVPQVRPGVNLSDMRVGAWQKIQETYEKTRDEKLKWLHRSHGLLIASFAVVLLVLVVFASLLPMPTSEPTQIIILTPTPTHVVVPAHTR